MKFFIPSPSFLVGALVVACILPQNSANSNCDDNSKLQYEEGKSYVYKVHLVTYPHEKPWNPEEHGGKPKQAHPFHQHHESPANRIKASITTEGRVALTALPNCQYVMTLSDLTQEVKAEQAGLVVRIVPVPRQSVKFTFKNGEVSGLLKTETGREPWADNILRGILTMVQNKALSNADGDPEERETNIKGDCVCKVKIPKEGVYQKYIHSGECSDAFISRQAMGVPYPTSAYTPVTKPNMHFLKDSHIRCTQQVDQGLISRVDCTARDHLLISKDSVSTIQVLTNETMVAATQEEITALAKDMPFVFDSSPNTLDESDAAALTQGVVRMTQAMFQDKDANKAELFLQLKEMIRFVSDFSQLEKALGDAAGSDTFQESFLKNIVREAIAEVGTDAAVVHLAKLVDNKQLDAHLVLTFYQNLPFSRDPTLPGLSALLTNLEGVWKLYQSDNFITFHLKEKKRIRLLLVGASAYAYQFCHHNPSCATIPQYESVANQISQFCDSKQVDIAPACAQALGNLPHLPANSVNVIKSMLKSTGELVIGLNRKITAFDAFRRDPCQPELKTLAREDLENTQNSQELRIVAYLAVARCSQEEDLAVIDKILQTQWDSSLSSFIASHLYNIMDSQSPSKSYLKAMPLGQLGIPANIATVHNNTMSSRFWEYSMFRPDSNVGFSSEAYVIFNDEGSPMPMFAQFNMTIDWFGKSYNKVQLGASRRYIPKNSRLDALALMSKGKMAKFAPMFEAAKESMLFALLSVDSYVRIFGTTVAMGPDLFDAVKAPHFMDKEENKTEKTWRLDLVKAATLVDKEVIIPNMVGIPITMTAQAIYLPIIRMNHSGDALGLGVFDLLSKWNEKSDQFRHESTSDTGFIGKVSFHAGKGTPVSMGYSVKATVHLNHSIAYESIKNASSNWVKRVEFPDNILWSERVTVGTKFSVDAAGQQVVQWPVFGENGRSTRRPICAERMGLQFSVDILKAPHEYGLEQDVMLKVEKTEASFTGYSLDIESKPRSGKAGNFDVKLTADGLSTEDQVQINFDYDIVGEDQLASDNDRAKSTFTLQTDITKKNTPSTGFRASYSIAGFPKSQANRQTPLAISTVGLAAHSSYAFSLESWHHAEKTPLLDWNITNEIHSSQAVLKFLGPMEPFVGTITTTIDMPISDNKETSVASDSAQDYYPETIVKVDISQESRFIRKNGVAIGFSNTMQEGYQLNTTVSFFGRSYRLHQHLPKRHLESSESGDNLVSQRYFANYHDGDAKEVTVKAQYDDRFYSDSSRLSNVSLHITGPKPVVTEGRLYRRTTMEENTKTSVNHTEVSFFVIASGRRMFDYTVNENLTETGVSFQENTPACQGWLISNEQGEQSCVTLSRMSSLTVTDKGHLHTSLSNSNKPQTEFNMSFSHSRPDFSGDIRVISETPEASRGLKVKHSTWLNLQNVPSHGKKIIYTGVSEVDIENRTFATNSHTTVNPGWKNFTLTTNGTWPENLLNGDIAIAAVHKCPQTKVVVDILNQARSPQTPEEVFNNTLTVLWRSTGRSREAQPQKQFTWVHIRDSRLTPAEKEKYQTFVKSSNQMKVLVLSQPAVEIFQLQGNTQLKQVIGGGLGGLTMSEQGNVIFKNQPKAAWNFDLEAETAELETANEVQPTDVATTTDTIPTIKWRGDGWFETSQPVRKNNTWSSQGSSYMTVVNGFRSKEVTSFVYKQIDMAQGTVVMSVEADVSKDIMFKDFTHFSVNEKVTIITDNRSNEFAKLIVLNGPHLTVYFKMNDTAAAAHDNMLIDFAGGMYEEKHQHKFNWRSSGQPHHDHHHHHHPHHQAQGQLHIYHIRRPHPPPPPMLRRLIPTGNYNYTISK